MLTGSPSAHTENRDLKDEAEIEKALAFGEYIKNGMSFQTLQRPV